MKVREFPVLTDEDEPLTERIAVGVGENPARVLAYLLRRAEREEFAGEPASLLAVQVGTDRNRSSVRSALDRLEARDLVETTAIRDETPGRPPKAWRVSRGVEATLDRVYDGHASALLERAAQFPNESNTSGESPEPAEPAQPDERPIPPESGAGPDTAGLSLALNWRPNGLHAPFFVADADGAYDDRGLDVSFEAGEGSRAALDSVVAGDADVAVAGAATLLRARAADARVVPIAALYQHAMTTIYTLGETFEESFDRAAQLRGRRVGMPVDSEVGLLSRLFLSQAGVLSDVEVVDLPGEERAALLSGEVDAVTGSFSDPRELAAEGRPVESLSVAERFPIPGPAVVATERTLSERRSELAAFLAATAVGWATATGDPDRAGRAVAAESDRDADDARRAFAEAEDEFGTSDAVRKHGWGWRPTDSWRRLETALEQVGLLDSGSA